jgi:UDP-N-acetylmuramate dehydrogenase
VNPAAHANANAVARVNLSDCTTIGLGGPARRFIRASTEDELIEAVTSADARAEPVLILGGGSNLVVADEGFPGTVIQIATSGFEVDGGRLTVAAGEGWDGVVARSVGAGLAGLECLSGIPGRAGATPIQNVGAYGQEVSQVIASVRVLDRAAGTIMNIPNDECGFGYRTSKFRGSGGYVVLSVTFALTVQELSAPVRYAELAAALGAGVGDQVASTQARSAVIELRRRKGMVIDPGDPDTRSVGSFFVNPVLDADGREGGRGQVRGGRPGAAVRRGGRAGEGAGRLADRAGRLRQGLRPRPRRADLRQAHPRPG